MGPKPRMRVEVALSQIPRRSPNHDLRSHCHRRRSPRPRCLPTQRDSHQNSAPSAHTDIRCPPAVAAQLPRSRHLVHVLCLSRCGMLLRPCLSGAILVEVVRDEEATDAIRHRPSSCDSLTMLFYSRQESANVVISSAESPPEPPTRKIWGNHSRDRLLMRTGVPIRSL